MGTELGRGRSVVLFLAALALSWGVGVQAGGRIRDAGAVVTGTAPAGIVDSPEGNPPTGHGARLAHPIAEVVMIAPLPAPIPPVFDFHCATNLADCARSAESACSDNGLGHARSASLTMCDRGDGSFEGCCTFECGAQGGPATGSGTCSAGS